MGLPLFSSKSAKGLPSNGSAASSSPRAGNRSCSLFSCIMGCLLWAMFTYNMIAFGVQHEMRKLSSQEEGSVITTKNGPSAKMDNNDNSSDLNHDAAMALWWMSNLRDTPLRLTNNDDSGGEARKVFVFPPETKKVWVDVGVNRETDFIPDLNNDNSLFVLGFEPSKLWKPCPHKHCVVFWAANTPNYDVVNLNVQGGGDLCDSLLKPNSDTTSQLWKGCVRQETDQQTGKPKTVQVPGIPLHSLVERIPQNVEIEYIKIDAQGYDLEVMKGALAAPRGRIQVVSLESMDVDDDSKLLYLGQPKFSQVKAFLEDAGWIYVNLVSNHGVKGEINAFFVSDSQYISKVERLTSILMSNKEGKGKL